jgi:hypothetical protein
MQTDRRVNYRLCPNCGRSTTCDVADCPTCGVKLFSEDVGTHFQYVRSLRETQRENLLKLALGCAGTLIIPAVMVLGGLIKGRLIIPIWPGVIPILAGIYTGKTWAAHRRIARFLDRYGKTEAPNQSLQTTRLPPDEFERST